MHVFKKGQIYGRVGSSSRAVENDLLYMEVRDKGSIASNFADIATPYFKYVERPKDKKILLEALQNPNIRHVRINGVGGTGKTSFVHHICSQILNKEISLGFEISSLIWVTGKMDQFKADGEIVTLRADRLDYREMLETIARVLLIDENVETKELQEGILKKLAEYPALLVLDNMETVDDPRIIEFYKNIPEGCHIIFTSRSDLAVSFTRLDIEGFEQTQFIEYIANCLEEYRPDKKRALLEEITPLAEEFRKATGGSPILTSFVMAKICKGHNVSLVLKGLKEIAKDQSFYNNVMNFCFNDVFEGLPSLAKEVLCVMSLSDDEKEVFSLEDLASITESDELDVDQALQAINGCSFCSMKEGKYSCPLLIRAFVAKKIGAPTERYRNLAERYYSWLRFSETTSESRRAFYNRVKASDYQKKTAVAAIDDINYRYGQTRDFASAIDGFDKVIKDHPQFGYVYYAKAKFVQDNQEFSDIDIDSLYQKAIEADSTNGFYDCAYAFYLRNKKNSTRQAVVYFRKAIENGDDTPNVHHGIAVALAKLYDPKKDDVDPEEVLEHFVKGYVKDQPNKRFSEINAMNADAHARFLNRLRRHDEALEVCEHGLAWLPEDTRLLQLEGNIKKAIDPTAITPTQIRKTKTGLFRGMSDEDYSDMCKEFEQESGKND